MNKFYFRYESDPKERFQQCLNGMSPYSNSTHCPTGLLLVISLTQVRPNLFIERQIDIYFMRGSRGGTGGPDPPPPP